jgi:hypothetical protein
MSTYATENGAKRKIVRTGKSDDPIEPPTPGEYYGTITSNSSEELSKKQGKNTKNTKKPPTMTNKNTE